MNAAAMKKQRAYALFRSGSLDEARDLCRSLCESVPSDPEIWCLLAAIYNELGLYVEAERSGLRAIRLKPDYTQAIYNTAAARYNLRKVDSALEGLLGLARCEPGNWRVPYLMGQCYDEQPGRASEAVASYEKALELCPQPPRGLVRKLLNAYERVAETDKHDRLVEHYLGESPDDPMVGIIKARSEEEQGRLDLAEARLEEILARQDLLADDRA